MLAAELSRLGAVSPREGPGVVRFAGGVAAALRACLWSRTASRILAPLVRVNAAAPDDVYVAARGFPWEDQMTAVSTLAVDFSGKGSGIDNTMYGAQLVKDAVVDRLRERLGARPSVDLKTPDIRIACRLRGGALEIARDLSGQGLHKRGYRLDGGEAPIRENLAAAILLKSGWDDIARDGGIFLDPMCGSGTLVIEAALIAADIAPGLLREKWGFTSWPRHDPSLWNQLVEEASGRRTRGIAHYKGRCFGFDADGTAVNSSRHNARRSGAADIIDIRHLALGDIQGPPAEGKGLVLTNPPYGVRLNEGEDLRVLYAELGSALKKHFTGWRASVITAEPELCRAMDLRAHKTNVFNNGALECRLLQFNISEDRFVDREAAVERKTRAAVDRALARGGEAFANRLKKNLRTTGRWARREGISCYRLYDADLPEYSAAIDIYGDMAHVQEYAPPPTVDPVRAAERLEDLTALVSHVLGVPAKNVFVKTRSRQRGSDQYHRISHGGRFHEVREGPCRLLVNLEDYLDTGLFLDHRPTRAMIAGMCGGKRFLNLFCYTAAATVHAALGGAASSVSVDLSQTYLDWAAKNFELNGIDAARHLLVRADCREWISSCRGRFDVIFLDPPTFSNSKRMHGTFDVQRDHAPLVVAAAKLLSPDGTLFFSTNRNRFKLDAGGLNDLKLDDITIRTIPEDFKRNAKIHRCWAMTREIQSPGR